MNYVFVAGEGDPDLLREEKMNPDQKETNLEIQASKLKTYEEQSAEFLDVATNLCEQYAKAAEQPATVTLYKTPRHKGSAQPTTGVTTQNYSDARQLVTSLRARNQRFVLGICGHGSFFLKPTGYAGKIGYVEICQGQTAELRQISAEDINSFSALVVYFGLHCYAQCLTNQLIEIFGFPVIGEEKAQNTHMHAFTQQSSKRDVPGSLDRVLNTGGYEDVDGEFWRDVSTGIPEVLRGLRNSKLTQEVKAPPQGPRPPRWQ